MICMTVLVVMLVALCLSKAYASFIQRLFLYLIVTAILVEVCQAANFMNLIHFSHHKEVCIALGFVTNWIDNIASIKSLSIIIWTIILAVMSLKRVDSSSLATHWKVVLDLVYLVTSILLPLSCSHVDASETRKLWDFCCLVLDQSLQ